MLNPASLPVVLNADDWHRWWQVAKPGDWCIYHTGLLAKDRDKNLPVDERAWLAWDFSQRGGVHLFQRRVVTEEGNSMCLYLAQKRDGRMALHRRATPSPNNGGG